MKVGFLVELDGVQEKDHRKAAERVKCVLEEAGYKNVFITWPHELIARMQSITNSVRSLSASR